MNKKGLMLLILLFTFGMLLAACGGSTESDDSDSSEENGDTEDTEEPEVEVDEGTADDGSGGDEIQLGSGSTGGTYYPLGQQMANVLNDNVELEGFDVSSVSTDASVDNLARIGRGEMELGMAVHLTALKALAGEDDFDGNAVENFGFMGHIYPEVMQVITTEQSGITSIDELEGARVNIGPPGSASNSAATMILEAHGLEEGDYEAYEEGFGDAASRLQNGNLEANFGLLGLPAGNITELSTQREVVFLPIEGEGLANVEENSDYGQLDIEADQYDFLDESVSTVTAYAILVGSTDLVDEETGYEITKQLYENVDSIEHGQSEHMTMENIINGSEGLPLHPGSEQYFEEEGLLE
ncbi:TAXI family TRAP transporter solute-binding subunit [Salibacterium salarium]|uniref:TAXI family TRAP transporter solute-binding subunit n=1 Tax=Salibacterium salarium TaxID=284579 RepID=A0A3R9QQ97_9BACI|nr:TAXI family TRAP transporter solute-binding subunit [Salibacterium salarium]RSL30998.1 TAXI family TRAP transporter solute-binding subunit [Salibacterium salarium]